MLIDRRSLLTTILAAGAAGGAGTAIGANPTPDAAPRASGRIRRIATEEGFAIPELIEAVSRYMREHGDQEPGLPELRHGFPPLERFPWGPPLVDFERRIADMDRDGIDHAVLLVMSPGIQIFEPAEGLELARLVNDRAAEVVRRYPGRFTPLAALAPQAPDAAAQELERAVRSLGMKGGIINSHTKGEYLDDPRFWPIFAAAQALEVPIYLHPREPSPQMLAPYLDFGLSGAMWGYAAETGLHALRLILAGVFDEFPRLRLVLGHLGEGIPYYLDRIDNRYRAQPRLVPAINQLQRLPSEYFREHFWITSSGANWAPAVRFCQQVLGVDRVLFAVDYPFEDQPATVAQALAIPMPATEQESFFHGNAERVFGIAPVTGSGGQPGGPGDASSS